MLVWDRGTTGARYFPDSDEWNPISTTGAPQPEVDTQGVWTGKEWILWGDDGLDPENPDPGGRYDPELDGWGGATATGAPDDRIGAATVWTGAQVIFWGGSNGGVPNLASGGLYCAETPVFEDGFESGDLQGWTTAEP